MSYSILSRFTASLAGNLMRSVVSFVSGVLLARWLGTDEYGRLVFLLASFTALRGLLDMGSSAAFFTFLSRCPRSRRFVVFYWIWVGMQLIVAVGAVGWLLPDSLVDNLWQGESSDVLMLALCAAFMQNTAWNAAAQMAEASRETVRLQKLNFVIVGVHLVVLIVARSIDQLSLPLIFSASVMEYAVASWFAARLYHPAETVGEKGREGTDTIPGVGREFLEYCLPIFPYTLLGFAYEFVDRWMLQHWGGSSEQAYYGVAQQFSAVALLATASILRVLWKEVAEASYRGDRERVASLYTQVSRQLYLVSAVFAGGLLPWSSEIVRLTVGSAYEGGATTVMLMFVYPVHQSMGQITATLFYATGQIRLQVRLGLFFMSISMIISYFMMAPSGEIIPGFGLGSRGLAWKMVLLQIVAVNASAWFIARRLGIRWDWLYQVVGMAGCLGMGWLAYWCAGILLEDAPWVLLKMAGAGCLYLIFVFGLIYGAPWLACATRDQIHRLAKRACRIGFAGA
ncbi:MAG: lipopolysaccharide biosynthesis protein [Magnetococcales bacterium]|nr:lipopolysaccharide biosynthesis protein [Magnetococcales bacterium]